jgi:hypothetical protein
MNRYLLIKQHLKTYKQQIDFIRYGHENQMILVSVKPYSGIVAEHVDD